MVEPLSFSRRGRMGGILVLVCLMAVYILGFLNRGFAEHDAARTLAWTLCGILGIYGAVNWSRSGFRRPRIGPHGRILLLMVVAALVLGLQIVPLNRPLVTGLSPQWRETMTTLESAGASLPDKIPFALAPDKAERSLSQLFAALLFFAGVSVFTLRRSGAIWLLGIVAAASVFEGLLGIINYGLGGGGRVSAAIYNPNHHATMVLMGIPAAITLALKYRAFRIQRRRDSGPALFLGGLVLLALVGSLAALSRGALISGLMVLGGWGALEAWGLGRLQRLGKAPPRLTPEQKWATGLLTGAFLLLIVSASLIEGYTGRFVAPEGQVTRGDLARAAWAGFQESHYLGVGLGATEFLINQNADWATTTNAVWAHNDYLQILVEVGLPGLLICLPFLLLALAGLRGPIRGLLSHSHWNQNMAARSAAAGVLIALIHAAVDFHLRIPLIGFQFLILLSLACCAAKRRRTEDETSGKTVKSVDGSTSPY